MKDRDTFYRVSQRKLMSCSFDSSLPTNDAVLIDTPFTQILDNCVNNSKEAGEFLQRHAPNAFGATEQAFFLTPNQIGKVRGDIFESLIRTLLWNASIQRNVNRQHLAPIFSITLGDNYDLKKLLTPESRDLFVNFELRLKQKNTELSYSTPDFITFTSLDRDVIKAFSKPIHNLSDYSQDILSTAKEIISGRLRPEDIILAGGIKTSIRSDRMYQLLYEANSWKAIWRSIFRVHPSRYYALIGGTYGANPRKLSSVEFTSLFDLGGPTRAIDGIAAANTPRDIVNWFLAATA